MNTIFKLIPIVLLLSGLFISCNRDEKILPDEDYTSLFPKKSPDEPYKNYDDMVIYPCNPTENELNFQYPGVDISENIRDYTVLLKIHYVEKRFFNIEQHPNSQFEVRYVDENKKLVILRNYEYGGKPADILNNKELKIKLKVKSGYPLYLATHGYGFNAFDINLLMTAKSDDQVITSPELEYTKYLYSDGSKEMEPFCEKVILP